MDQRVFGRVLVAVDDSPGALAAVRVAVALAAHTAAVVRFLHVGGDGEAAGALTSMGRGTGLATRSSDAAASLLRHVGTVAEQRGVASEGASGWGHPAALVLAEARRWQADLVVIGRSGARGPGRTAVGSVTREVLEFADVPVLVVPRSENQPRTE
ncbi:universal stress protein [Georgenia satyanarayanai]|uniref:universal stress protein n=1 Tax=Georgenia satyanarayanai TaxID=860221 RepID=UPI00186ABEA4|nr:universal stress protein [Georgenia satyanarayanai]